MSVACIEVLSSDDEVEIIGEVTNTSSWTTENGKKPPSQGSKNVLQKLSRNSNIELTINLENTPDEPAISKSQCGVSSVVNKNGFRHSNSPKKELQNTEKSGIGQRKASRSASPDVVIIDDDVPAPAPKPNSRISANEAAKSFLQPPKTLKFPRIIPKSAPQNPSPNTFISNKNHKQVMPPSTPSIKFTSNGTVQPYFVPQHLSKSSKNTGFNKGMAPSGIQKSTMNVLSQSKNSLASRSAGHSAVNMNSPSGSSSKPIQKSATSQAKRIQPTSLPPAMSSSSRNPLFNDVVYIIDDGSDEEVKISKPTVNIKASAPQASPQKSFSQIQNSKKSSPKKPRVSSEKEITSQDFPASPSGKGRVTRSSSSSSVTSEQSTSKRSPKEKSKPLNPLDIRNQPLNKFSVENMFKRLVDFCNKIFTDDKLESKLWNTFKQASDKILRSEEFISALKTALNTTKNSNIERLEEKLCVKRDVKDVLRIMKRNPAVIDKKVKKLTKMLNLIRARIKKIEETEVTSDEDGDENPYVLLDRYRVRATKIYEKICELQGESSDAGRLVRQRFTFTGTSGYPKIEQALQKFYQKTKCFPDFLDVKNVVELTVKKENLDMPPIRIHNIAQSLFVEFGNRLQRMRCFDEYSIMNEYLDDGKAKDPALDNEELHKALASYNSTRKLREAEQKIFEEFTCREVEQKAKGDCNSDGGNDGSDDEGTVENGAEALHFSDTDEELINGALKDNHKRRHSSDEEEAASSSKVPRTDLVKSPKLVLPKLDLNQVAHLASPSKS